MAFGDVVQFKYGGAYCNVTLDDAPTPGNLLVFVKGAQPIGSGGVGGPPYIQSYLGEPPPGPLTWEFVRGETYPYTSMWYRVVEAGDPADWLGVAGINDHSVYVEFEGPFSGAVLDTSAGRSHVYMTECLVDITPTPGQPTLLVSLAGASYSAGAWTGFTATPAAGMTTIFGGATNQGWTSLDVSKRVVIAPSGTYSVGITGWMTPYEEQSVLAAAFVGAPLAGDPGMDFDPPVGALDDATKKSIKVELDGTGSGQFTINRYSPNATPEILKDGNLVKVRIPRIDGDYLFSFFLENPEAILASADEKGDETVTITGRGGMAYTDRAIWLAESFVVPWWPATMGTPPAGARGAVIVKAGRYRHYNVTGSPLKIEGLDVDGDGFWWFTTAGFSAYWDTNKTYDWDDENSQRYLVHLVTTEDPSSPDYSGFYFHPNQAGVKNYPKVVTPGTINDTIPLTDIGDGDKPGQVLYRIWQEAVAADRPIHPTPLWTVDFTDTEDSNGDPWTVTDALKGLTADLGEPYLTTIGKLMATGVLDVVVSPDLLMSAYNHYGRDLTGDDFGAGVVRFEKGVNIAERLSRQLNPGPIATWAQVVGTEGHVATAELADAAGRIPRETAARGETTDTDALEALGLAELERQLSQSDSTTFNSRTDADDEDTGRYLPGPAGTAHGKYWVGDLVRLHTGTADQDFNEVDQRVIAITIAEDEAANLEVTNELGAGLDPASREVRDVRAWRGDAGGVVVGAPPGFKDGGLTMLTTSSTSSSEPPSVTASEVSIEDAAALFAAVEVESALQELASKSVGYQAHGNTGSTETFDAAIGSHSATVDASCTFSLTGATAGVMAALYLELTAGSPGPYTITWPGSVVWMSGSAPALSTTPGDVIVVTLFSHDGGTTWLGFSQGGSGSASDAAAIIVPLTNKSGASAAAGDVVVISAATADAFTTTVVSGATLPIGVAQETIANDAIGAVAIAGYVALVNTGGATPALRSYAETSGTAKQATSNASRRAGSFGVFLTSSATPDAILFGQPDLMAVLALSSATPVQDGGAGSAGTGTAASKDDHKHPGDKVGIVAVFDGAGAALTTGVKLDLEIPFACTITGWALLLDQSGSIVVDVWKDTYANYPPTVADTIVAAAKPTVASATKNSSTTLTGWTIALSAGDTLRLNIDSVANVTRATLTIAATRA